MYTKTKAPVTNKRKYGLVTLNGVNTFPWTNHPNDVLQHTKTYYDVPHRTTTHHELPLLKLPCTTTYYYVLRRTASFYDAQRTVVLPFSVFSDCTGGEDDQTQNRKHLEMEKVNVYGHSQRSCAKRSAAFPRR